MLVIFLLVTTHCFSVLCESARCCMELIRESGTQTNMVCDMRYRVAVGNAVQWKLADRFRWC